MKLSPRKAKKARAKNLDKSIVPVSLQDASSSEPSEQSVTKLSKGGKSRRRMWESDPCCFWCGEITIYGGTGEHSATIDHLYSRLHPKRSSGGGPQVLACNACNQERNNADHRNVVFIPKLAKRIHIARETSVVTAKRRDINIDTIEKAITFGGDSKKAFAAVLSILPGELPEARDLRFTHMLLKEKQSP